MDPDRKRLLGLFDQLGMEQQETLLAFAEFLVARPGPAAAAAPAEPRSIPRPANETVVMAIRRLTETYPMLDRRALFNDASRHMAEHALAGRAAGEVIDELEVVFARQYERMRDGG